MAYRDNLSTVVNPRDNYRTASHLVVEQRNDNGIIPTQTMVAIRRVIPSGGKEELQVEIVLTSFHKKRMTQAHGELIVTPEIADMIAKACGEMAKTNASE